MDIFRELVFLSVLSGFGYSKSVCMLYQGIER